MHEAMLAIGIAWSMGLVLVLVVFASRVESTMARVLALEVLSLTLTAALAMVAIARDRQGYLDIALVIAMLGFAQTLAARRLVAGNRGLR